MHYSSTMPVLGRESLKNASNLSATSLATPQARRQQQHSPLASTSEAVARSRLSIEYHQNANTYNWPVLYPLTHSQHPYYHHPQHHPSLGDRPPYLTPYFSRVSPTPSAYNRYPTWYPTCTTCPCSSSTCFGHPPNPTSSSYSHPAGGGGGYPKPPSSSHVVSSTDRPSSVPAPLAATRPGLLLEIF